MTALLQAISLHHHYPGGVPALKGLDLSITQGRKLAILGANGAGKTTLLLHLNGSLKPSSGEIRLDGQPVAYSRAALAAWRRRVGLVLQEADDQLFAASVGEDVSFGPLNLGLSEEEAAGRVAEALESLRITDLAERPTHMLSFGQKKRAAIAGALAMRPEVLLLDEPSAGLDQHSTTHLLAVLGKLSEGGTTLVFTTHDVDLAFAFADEVALFDQGKVLAQGDALAILSDEALLKTARLKPPFVLELGLQARWIGLIGEEEALPRTRAEALELLGRVRG
jgi:cobalt/nickel transport system ATP-binding protein